MHFIQDIIVRNKSHAHVADRDFRLPSPEALGELEREGLDELPLCERTSLVSTANTNAGSSHLNL